MRGDSRRSLVRALVLALLVLIGAVLVAETAAANERAFAARGCPPLSEAASLPLRPGGGRLHGDIDGDGRRDLIAIHDAPTSYASCGFLLVVETARDTLAARLPEWYKPPQDLAIRDWWLPEPYLAAVVRVAPRRAQIVVARAHGASVADVTLYGLVGDKLELLHFSPRRYHDELLLFGTVGTGYTNVRCSPGGPLSLLSQGPTTASGRRWFTSRSDYRLADGTLMLVRTRVVRSSAKDASAIARRWRMDALPFTGCAVSRGKRL